MGETGRTSGSGVPPGMNPAKFRRGFILLLLVGISLLFFAMIRVFVTALLLGAIFSGLSYPLYQKLQRGLGGRAVPASLLTILIFLLVLVVPLSIFAGIVTAEAIQVTQDVGPWVERQVRQRERIEELIRNLPFSEVLVPYTDQILSKVGELAGRTGTFVVEQLAAFTRGTVVFFFMLFVMLYAMFFFLKDGEAILERILYYMPLSTEDEYRMLDRFVSVTRATVKGTLIIGILQGALAGLAFAFFGVPGAAFWGTIMAVLSILPGVGSAIVWIPAVVYLFVVGEGGAAVGLFIWCAAVVGTVDNLLRPRLVGKDTQLPDLMILLGTLGGVVVFGAAGVIVGPIVAALFITVWEIYGVAFRDVLPSPVPVGSGRRGAAAGALRSPETGAVRGSGAEPPPAPGSDGDGGGGGGRRGSDGD